MFHSKQCYLLFSVEDVDVMMVVDDKDEACVFDLRSSFSGWVVVAHGSTDNGDLGAGKLEFLTRQSTTVCSPPFFHARR
jgi:hypothetical protein